MDFTHRQRIFLPERSVSWLFRQGSDAGHLKQKVEDVPACRRSSPGLGPFWINRPGDNGSAVAFCSEGVILQSTELIFHGQTLFLSRVIAGITPLPQKPQSIARGVSEKSEMAPPLANGPERTVDSQNRTSVGCVVTKGEGEGWGA